MMVLGIAFCGTALICLLLVKQAQKRQGNRRWSSDGPGSDGGNYAGDAGGHHSHSHGSGDDHSASGDPGSSGDSDGNGGGGGDGGGAD
jgi:hypothetical protein